MMPRFIVAFALALALVVGCGPGHGHVAGTVTVDGVPLEYGIVNLVAPGGAASAPVLDGRFEAGGVPVGTVRIAVRSLPRPVVAEPSAGRATWSGMLPERYLSPDESGLVLEVRSGRQHHDIAISAK